MRNALKNPWFLMGILVASLGVGGTIKSWSAGEPLTAAQLNANFSHIHSSLVGAGHNLLVNADVSGTANIASSKLAQGAGFVDAMVRVGDRTTACSADPCTITSAVGVSAVNWSSTGTYVVNFSPALSGNAILLVSTSWMTTGVADRWCFIEQPGAGTISSVGLRCRDTAAALADTSFSVIALNATAP